MIVAMCEYRTALEVERAWNTGHAFKVISVPKARDTVTATTAGSEKVKVYFNDMKSMIGFAPVTRWEATVDCLVCGKEHPPSDHFDKYGSGSLQCPKCGAYESHPDCDNVVVIRGFKVDGWSQCLRCSGLYDENLMPTGVNDEEKGWFY